MSPGPRARGCAAAAAVLAAGALAGCSSGGSGESLPSYTAGTDRSTSSAPASGSATGSATAGGTASSAVGSTKLVRVDGDLPSDALRRDVRDAYVRFWQADMEALTRADPAYPPLLATVIDPQRAETVDTLGRLHSAGQRVAGRLRIAPRVLGGSTTATRVTDCVDFSATYNIDAKGAKVAGTEGTRVAYVTDLVRQGAHWRVSNIDVDRGRHC